MIDPQDFRALAESLTETAQAAGAAIMAVRDDRLTSVRYKEDKSPVTDADERAEAIILQALAVFCPGIPVVAEEAIAAGSVPSMAASFFLVDPLDGTRAFIQGSSEFTVNIALVSEGAPVFGIVYAPVLKDCYLTTAPGEAVRFKLDPVLQGQPLRNDSREVLNGVVQPESRPRTALVSPTRATDKDDTFLRTLGSVVSVPMFSSLKFCVLANGGADVYPRFGATSQWDTAAGQAVLEASGGSVLKVGGERLTYGGNGESYANPNFIAWRSAGEAVQVS